MNLLAVSFDMENVGRWVWIFVGLVIVSAIVFAIMRACSAPPWAYKVAAVGGLVLLLIFVLALFFGAP